jgi:hypothetical protein
MMKQAYTWLKTYQLFRPNSAVYPYFTDITLYYYPFPRFRMPGLRLQLTVCFILVAWSRWMLRPQYIEYSKLLSGFPFIGHGNPGNNLESPCVSKRGFSPRL